MRLLIGILSLFISISSFADSLTLHLIKSPKGINWKTPFSLTTSTLKNQIANTGDKRAFSISHVFVELNCSSIGTHIFRGQTSIADSGEVELIFKKKYGLGVMFHTYEGFYETDEVVLRDLAPYRESSRYGSFTAKVSPSTCERLLQYEKEYVGRGYGLLYSGLQADPLKGEGAGCSAYGMSYMRVGGLMQAFHEEWKQIIDVPKRFVGGPLTNKKVNILKLLTRPNAQWSNKEPHIHLEAWDPEQMLRWVKKTYDNVLAGQELEGYNVEIWSQGKAKHVSVDLSHLETPTGPIWLN